MAKIDGNYFRIKLGTVTLASTNDVDFTLTKDVQETTTQDSLGYKYRHGTCGVREVTGSFKGAYDPSGALSVVDIADMIINNEGLLTIQVGDTQSGGTYYQFSGIVNSVGESGSNDKIPTFSGNFVSSGAVVTKIVGGGVPPAVDSQVTTGVHTILVGFDKTMIDPTGFEDDFTITIDAAEAAITSVVRSLDKLYYTITITETMGTGDAILLSIASGNIASEAGALLATVTDYIVLNNN